MSCKGPFAWVQGIPRVRGGPGHGQLGPFDQLVKKRLYSSPEQGPFWWSWHDSKSGLSPWKRWIAAHAHRPVL